MVKSLAKRVMATNAQKACYVIDHLIEALADDPSSSLRRAMILADIDSHVGTTQTGIMERLGLHKSAVNREVEWLFNYGCIMRHDGDKDARAVHLQTCGYSKKALNAALDYFKGSHERLQAFLKEFAKQLRQEKPNLRDAKIVAIILEKGKATKQDISQSLYKVSPSSENRAINKLMSDGVIDGDVV